MNQNSTNSRRLFLQQLGVVGAGLVGLPYLTTGCNSQSKSSKQASMPVNNLVKDIGAERVLLGTQMPFMNPAGAMSAVNEPGFEEENRRWVMAGNARRLLGL